ncbi:MAG: Peptidase family M50 [Planctomycetes bacterium ADurb.Bin412]|nr:MAG: Peptidase family M50 [Planctomycetes bacterium ADurb.Bin412]
MSANQPNELPLPTEEIQDDLRALPKTRRDVEITEQVYYGKPCYVLKDPASMRYYRLRPPEYAIYQMLDGKANMDDVLRMLLDRFPNEEYDRQAVMSFIIMLRGANLLHVSGETSTEFLLKRKHMMTRGFFKKLHSEFLFYRIPVMDPNRLLNFLHRWIGGFLFSRFMGFLVLALLAGAVYVLFDNIDKLHQRQPLLSWLNLLYFGAAFLFIKVIHEFGHGLTAKHFGCEVHEMGILFLVFTPCFYCDVSDSWMIGVKGRRMWITAAGILVEMVLSCLAVYVWAFTEPKTVINQFMLNMMIVASVNTILFNGNPLLRYDGYYFLMDLLEIPNLKQKGTNYLKYLMQRYVLGMERADKPIDVEGREITVLGYAVCSAIYRWFIMFVIVLLVWTFLDPYGWGVIGAILAVGSIYNAFVTPLVKMAKFAVTQRQQLRIRLATAIVLVLAVGLGAYFVLAIPIEQTVDTQCVIRPRQAHPIYVSQAGFIESAKNPQLIRDGQAVRKDDILLVLSNPQLEYEVSDLQLQIDQLNSQKALAENLEDNETVLQIEAKRKGLQAQYDRARQNYDKLTIRSPIDGMVQLRTPVPLANLDGSFMPLQSALFVVYAPGEFEAVAAVNHRDNGFIESGQAVQIKLWSLDHEILDSRVVENTNKPVWKMFSPAFSTVYGGEVATMPAAKAEEALEPADRTYELVLPLAKDARLRDGLVGRAKIIIEQQTLGRTVYLWFIQVLRQDLRL